jgi:hypothetical protein
LIPPRGPTRLHFSIYTADWTFSLTLLSVSLSEFFSASSSNWHGENYARIHESGVGQLRLVGGTLAGICTKTSGLHVVAVVVGGWRMRALVLSYAGRREGNQERWCHRAMLSHDPPLR